MQSNKTNYMYIVYLQWESIFTLALIQVSLAVCFILLFFSKPFLFAETREKFERFCDQWRV